MLSEGNDMPPIELSALADGISYASSVYADVWESFADVLCWYVCVHSFHSRA